MALFIDHMANCDCYAPTAGTWPTPWRRMRRRPSMPFSPGHWGKTGGGVFPASSNSGTSCGLASATGPPSAEPAVKRQWGADAPSCHILQLVPSFSRFFKSLSYPQHPPSPKGHGHMALPLCVAARAIREAQRRSAAIRREDIQPSP